MNPGSANISSRPQKNFLDPTSGNFVSGRYDSSSISRNSRHNSDEENRFAARKQAFEGQDTGLGMQLTRPSFHNNASGYNSSAASRSGSLPPSRNDGELSWRYRSDVSNTQVSARYSQPPSQQHNLSAHAPPYMMKSRGSEQRYKDQLSSSQMNSLLGDFGNLNVGRENQSSYINPGEATYGSSSNFGNAYNQEQMPASSEVWNREDNGYQTQQDQFSPTGSATTSLASNPNVRRGMGFAPSYTQSPTISDTRHSHTSPYYSTAGTPSTYQQRVPSRGGFDGTVVTASTATLDRKLRNIQQEQQAYIASRPNQMEFSQQYPPNTYNFPTPAGFQAGQRPGGYQVPPGGFQPGLAGLPMSQLSAGYPMPLPHHMATPHIPRGPARDHEMIQATRSPLLEDFRNNNKTNKRYELKVREMKGAWVWTC